MVVAESVTHMYSLPCAAAVPTEQSLKMPRLDSTFVQFLNSLKSIVKLATVSKAERIEVTRRNVRLQPEMSNVQPSDPMPA